MNYGQEMFALCSQYLAEYFNTAEDLFVGRGGIIETEGIRGRIDVAVEGSTGNDGYLVSQRLGNELSQISALGESAPEEQTAFGTGIFYSFGEMLIHSVKHQTALTAIEIADLIKVRQILVAGDEALAYHLAEDIGVNVLTLLCNDHLLNNCLGSRYKSHTHTCGEDL